jgi:polyisoprenoid-binding protein YceI
MHKVSRWAAIFMLLLMVGLAGAAALVPLLAGGERPAQSPTFLPTATPVPQRPTYDIDPAKSVITYTATGPLGVTFPGTFSFKSGTITLTDDAARPTLRIDAVIDGKSITAVNDLVLAALRSNLEVEKYPEGRFAAASVAPLALRDGAGTLNFVAKGELSLHGQTRPATMPFTLTIDPTQLSADGQMQLDLLDYKVFVPTAVMNSRVTFRAQVVARRRP